MKVNFDNIQYLNILKYVYEGYCVGLLAASVYCNALYDSTSPTCQMREEEVNQMRQEIAKQTKMREAIQKKFHQMEDQKADVDVQRETLKAQIAGLEKGTGACHTWRLT